MRVELLEIDSIERAQQEILSVGVDAASIRIMDKKAVSLAFKIYGCKFYHANILKQEALSIGMEAAIEKGCITAKTKVGDCLIFGDIRRLLILSEKLKKQSFEFLRELGAEVEEYIENLNSRSLIFRYNNKEIDLKKKFLVMGILNVTPDSFSDGGKYDRIDKAVARCESMLEEGADIIDIGGESTRPGSDPVSLEDEFNRVMPVIEAVKKRFNAVVSVDTYKSPVAKAALDFGADIINDISGMNFDEKMPTVLSNSECGIVAMHIKGKPKSMQNNPEYKHLLLEISEYFKEILKKTDEYGIDKKRIVFDPGIGFGKAVEDNYKILNNIKTFKIFKRPILVGLSKKSFIGYTLNQKEIGNRLFGTVGANVAALFRGASIFRVHDVKENVDALKLAASIKEEVFYT